MKDQTYLEIVKNAFHFLFDKFGYRIVHHVADDPYLNAQTFLQSNNLLIQIVNDWCLISVDIKPYDPQKSIKKQLSHFYDFRLILKLLEVPEEKELAGLYKKVLSEMFCEDNEWYDIIEKDRGVMQMNTIANILEKYHDQIVEIFSEERISKTKTKLIKIQKQI